MSWQEQLKGDSFSWLLEQDEPGVRYLALRDLAGLPAEDPQLQQAREQAHWRGPIASVLEAMHPEGFWEKPGPGYNPKYRSSVWAVILLAQLGASAACDPRVERAGQYLLEQALHPRGQFTSNGAPSGTIDCLQGNLCYALPALGIHDPRLEAAFEWMARSVTGEGLAAQNEKDAPLRYYAYKCGPVFACGANGGKPCAWGGVKVMLAFSQLPPEMRTPLMERAIQTGVEFLLGTSPAEAEYPTGWDTKPSGNWWKFGFPLFYVTDLLQNVEALVALGYAQDPRLARALEIIREKQDSNGRWALEYDYAGKTWGNFGPKKQANPWVTLRALRVLKQAHLQHP